MSDEFWWKRGPSPWKSLDVFEVLKLKLAHESHDRRSKKIVPHYVEEFLEILWRIRKQKLLSDNFSWKSRQKFWSWNLRTSRTTEEAKKSRQTTSSNSSKSIEELEKKNLFREMREQRLLIEAKKSCQPTLTEFFEIHRRTRKTRFVHEAKPLVWTFNSFLFRFSVFSVVSEVVLAIFQSFIFSWVHDFTQTLLGKVNKRSSGDKLKAARLKDLKIEWFLAVLWKVKYQQTY